MGLKLKSTGFTSFPREPMVWKPTDSETNEISETFKGGEVFLDVTSEACVLV